MDPGTRRDYRNVNSAIIVPRLNISLEDLIICICPAMLGNGIASILSLVSEEMASSSSRRAYAGLWRFTSSLGGKEERK
jgi:hypothetical protein